ncbi:MAG TPA: hypothetical protein VJY33_05595 [Isosphaeraceae bacterium]|nr:hypothetical protein [Isosphaeraceae bacterium]
MPDDPVATDAPLAQPSGPVRSPAEGDQAGASPASAGLRSTGSPTAGFHEPADASDGVRVIETVVSPFHCLYQDALHFHTQSRLAQSEGEAARLSRAALLLYICSAEALVRQAAIELGRPELRGLLADPSRPLPLAEAWRLLPAIVAEPGVPTRPFDPGSPPWPQFAELLMLETSWVYPGAPSSRRAYYRSGQDDGGFEPMEPHHVPAALKRTVRTETLTFPRTGLPRDPYALRPRHLDTARGILDAAIEALDRRMGGLLCQAQRHRREPVRLVLPTSNGPGA